MLDSDSLGATVALLGELDGDLEFFDGLFDDLPCAKGIEETGVTSTSRAATPGPPPLVAFTATSDRRRQRWLAIGRNDGLCGWKQVAKSLKHAREATEDENARLRRLIVARERTVKHMIKLMQRAVALPSPAIVVPLAGESIVHFMGPPADHVQITRSLDALARHAERVVLNSTVFAASSPLLQICGLENRIVRTETGDALEATLDVAWVLPFTVDAITSAMVANSMYLVTQKRVPNITTVFKSPELTIVQAVTAPKRKNGKCITKHGQVATRREPAGPDGSQLVVMDKKGGIYVDAKLVATTEADSCILVRTVPNHDSAARGPLAQVHWRRRFRVQPTSCVTPTPADRARWINALTTKKTRKIEHHVDKLAQAIENLLLHGSSPAG